MKFLHTADWHIGQLFHEYDRSYEHQQFLNWLVGILLTENIEVLLISGDIFDSSNPSAASVRMFYRFLNEATRAVPHLQIMITAGNHDSAARLAAPKPLLESSNVHIIGLVEKDAVGNIDYEKLLVKIHDASGAIKAFCLAIPFLRMGDYPAIADCANPYTEGVAALYQEAFAYAQQYSTEDQPIIAMGHLHTQQAEITDLDKTERLIMGGVECISASAFHSDIKYVALGHIHKAQKIGGKEHIRYCGSPLPMSFSEIHYIHQVIVFDLDREISNLKAIEIPVFVPLQRIPHQHQPLHEVIAQLEQLPELVAGMENLPYLQVCVLLDGPEPALRHKIETALAGKAVRLAKIDAQYPAAAAATPELITAEKLNELQPIDVFGKAYQSRYQSEVPQEIMQLFQQVAQEINQNAG
ncbi:exonuclease sbcCD subunit D [Chryseobacterium indologenes]|uniref:exonuclease SbcCD subunit D n=1 Tax=Chryseobacterium indologenes TaxID=253 RepID=UPI000BFD0B52|nr:exonuclease SbcCD subunit D C-terminal domain-containing protein [Chryseobacterium indologenes]ATN05962.1 exonuclease sbcCD subunit D [Chryseobacterium indologenes]AYY85277.1 exonuclease subunit SbcD [Chryseobacterium indologenes]QIX82176.1 exonuclease subunit SbcD [Chryseobacterium indologenes]UDQ55963.1 exonuclease SbcCD subunit D C-terminal domain-containing protein [Chryseobacterium indologenes]